MSSILDQYLKGPSKDPAPNDNAPHKQANTGGNYTQDRPVLMLDLVLADRTRVAFSYATLSRVLMEPERGIVLSFAFDEVLIEGTALENIYKAVIQHRASRIEITSNGRNLSVPVEGEAVITAIRMMNSTDSEAY